MSRTHESVQSGFGARLAALMQALGYDRKMAAFGQTVGLRTREHVSRLVSEKVSPSEPLIVAICCIHKVNRAWLERGEGPMFAGQVEAGDFTPVPLVNLKLAAGAGAEVHAEGELKQLQFRTAWLRGELRATVNSLVAMHVEGESMEPVLSPGDIVLVDRSRTDPTQAGLYALREDNRLLVKYTRVEAGRVMLDSENPAYPSTVFPWPGPIHRAQVIGRVVWAGKRF